MKKLNLLLPLVLLSAIAFGCRNSEKTTRGRLKYVETSHSATTGHGSRTRATDSRQFYANGWKWSPEKVDLNKFTGDCEAGPNEAVEAFKCHEYNDLYFVYVLRMSGDQPEWVTVSSQPSIREPDHGIWIDDGRQLIFRDFFYNVVTGERREIKGVPDYPANSFRAVSPDLKTLVFQGDCFLSSVSQNSIKYIELSEAVKKNREKICADEERFEKNKLEVLWLIDAETGATEFLELSRDKYLWLSPPHENWLQYFQQQLVWQKDETGRDRLVYPN